MRKPLLLATLLVVAAPALAQGHHRKPHHHHVAAAPLPDSVMLGGKEYKVCKAGMLDDCVQPHQAGLGSGNKPTMTYMPRNPDRHP